MAAELRIEQYAGAAMDHRGSVMQMPLLPAVAPAILMPSGAVSTASVVLDPRTRAIRVRCTGTPGIAFRLGDSSGGNPVAVDTDTSLVDGEVVFFGIEPNLIGLTTLKIAVIDN